MTERRESSDQLDLFRQPLSKSEGDVSPAGSGAVASEPGPAAPTVSPSEKPRVHQMTELKGETWEDAFGGKAA